MTSRIYRGTALGAETLHASGVTVTRFDDRDAAPGRLYYYPVTAATANAESAPTNAASAIAR